MAEKPPRRFYLHSLTWDPSPDTAGKGKDMDFGLNDEQKLLKDSVDRLLAEKYDFNTRKKFSESKLGWSREMWNQYAELGLLGVAFSEEHGGIGGGPVETSIVMEALGRSIALEPYVPTVVIGGGFIQAGGTDKQKAEMLPAIAEGKLLLAFAYTERHSRFDLADVTTKARKDGQGWVLDGEKALVWHGDSADKILVTARVSGNQRDKDGIGVFIVDANAAGLTRKPMKLADSHQGADIILKGVKVGAGGRDRRGRPRLSADRAGGRPRDRRDHFRVHRLHGRDAGHHHRIPEDPRTVRPADRQLSRRCSTAPSTC